MGKELRWRWSEMTEVADMVSDKAEQMTRLPHTDLLGGDSLITKFDESTVKDLMALITPWNMNAGFVDPHFESNATKKLPFYDVEYIKTKALDDNNCPIHEAVALWDRLG